jgi:uncharacterized protein YaiI (UPF0178 family)
MKIIIDGDSTPSKREIIETGRKHGVKVIVVISTAHYSEKPEDSYEETVLVDSRPQEADIKIMNLAEAGDIVLTNDMALSFMLQGKKAAVINSRGIIVSKKDLGPGMEILHEEKKMRRSGKIKRTGIKGPKKHSKADVKNLITALEKVITGL